MIRLVLHGIWLFLTGKLFKNYPEVFGLFSIGAALGLAITVGLAHVAPLWVAAGVGGLVAGWLQPILLRNIKYL